MPRWLGWYLGVFVAVNGLAAVANVPNPFTLLYVYFTQPRPEARTMDGGLHFLNLVVAVGMLVGWLAVAVVLALVFRKKRRR